MCAVAGDESSVFEALGSSTGAAFGQAGTDVEQTGADGAGVRQQVEHGSFVVVEGRDAGRACSDRRDYLVRRTLNVSHRLT